MNCILSSAMLKNPWLVLTKREQSKGSLKELEVFLKHSSRQTQILLTHLESERKWQWTTLVPSLWCCDYGSWHSGFSSQLHFTLNIPNMKCCLDRSPSEERSRKDLKLSQLLKFPLFFGVTGDYWLKIILPSTDWIIIGPKHPEKTGWWLPSRLVYQIPCLYLHTDERAKLERTC